MHVLCYLFARRLDALLSNSGPRSPDRKGPHLGRYINTACHIINRVYLHKFLKKTSYELLTDKKPNVSYFKVFGAKCWIRDPHHSSKFAPRAHEGFMLGYGKDSHTYRVFNNYHNKVVETIDVRFDETNGSQREQLPSDQDKLSPEEAIKLKPTQDILQILHCCALL